MIEALKWVTKRIEDQPSLASGLTGLEKRFAGKRIVGVTSHRRENFGEGMQYIGNAVKRIASRDDIAVIFPVHMNPNVRAVMNEQLEGRGNVALIEPLEYPHFARLLDINYLMLTDSGGVQEEAPALGKPVLVMRETERLLDEHKAYSTMARAHNPFGDGHSSQRICDLLAAS